MERQAEAVDLQRRDVAQPQAREIGHQHSVEPDGDAAVALAGRVRLQHVLVAVPAIELRDDVGPADEAGAVGELDAGVGRHVAVREEVVAVLAALLRVIEVDVEIAGRRRRRLAAPVLQVGEELVGAVRGHAGRRLAVDEVVRGDARPVVAGADDVVGRLELRVVAQEQHVLLGADHLVGRVGQLGGLLRQRELQRLAAAVDVRGVGGDRDVLVLVDGVPAVVQIGALRVALEVVGEDDVGVAADADVARVAAGDAGVALRQRARAARARRARAAGGAALPPLAAVPEVPAPPTSPDVPRAGARRAAAAAAAGAGAGPPPEPQPALAIQTTAASTRTANRVIA